MNQLVHPTGLPGRRYALITAARNEESFLPGTLAAVIDQTLRPERWIVVSDGSTDTTDAIVRRHAAAYPWIRLLRLPERRDRHFAAKARCFNAGREVLADLGCDYIGNLDADITVGPDYFAFLVERMAREPRLGVAGTPFVEDEISIEHHSFQSRSATWRHVSGACQLFRRACLDDIGGYMPVKGGAVDWIAVTSARQKGWETRTFPERLCFHRRALGTGNHRAALVPFHYGRKAHLTGSHPLWAILRGLYILGRRPRVTGGALFLAGYLWSVLSRSPRGVPRDLIAFHRAEQMARLRLLLRGKRRPDAAVAPV